MPTTATAPQKTRHEAPQVEIGDKLQLNQIFASALQTRQPARFMFGGHMIKATNSIEPDRSIVSQHELCDMEVVCFSGDSLASRMQLPAITEFRPLLGYFQGIWLTEPKPKVALPAGVRNHAKPNACGHLVGFALSRMTGNVTTLVEIGPKNSESQQPILSVVPFDSDKLALA